jgi:hypothetical protein
VGIAARDSGHDRGIHHPKSGDAEHAAGGIDNAV